MSLLHRMGYSRFGRGVRSRLPSGGLVRQTLGLDFTAPVVQSKPSTATGVIPGRTASYIFRCEESSGAGGITDELQSETLTASGSPLTGQTAVGLFDGTDAYSYKAVEASATGLYSSSGSSFLDLGASDSLAVLLVFRMGAEASTSGKLVEKRGGGVGYEVGFNGSGLYLLCDDGPDLATTQVAGDGRDGAWHCLLAVIDRNAGAAAIYTDSSNDSATLAAVGSLTNGDTFDIGGTDTLQVAYCAVFEGTEAEGLGQSDLDAFWTHATDPTGKLTTYSRSGALTDVVYDDATDGLYMTTYSADQYALGWHSAITGGAGFGLRCNAAATNLHAHSHKSENWTEAGGVSAASADLGDSPRGFREARLFTAASDNDWIGDTVTTSAETEYSHSIVLQRKAGAGGTTITGRLIQYDAVGAAEVDSTSFTLDHDKRVRIDLTATTNVGQTSTSVRLELDTSGVEVWHWGLTTKTGKPTLIVLTDGAPDATGATDARAAGDFVREKLGEIVAEFVVDTFGVGANQIICDTDSNDRRLLYFPAGGSSLTAQIRDSSGSTVDTPSDGAASADALHEGLVRWNSDGLPGGEISAVALDGARTGGSVGTFTAGGGYTAALYIGANLSQSVFLDGLIATLKTYDRPRSV